MDVVVILFIFLLAFASASKLADELEAKEVYILLLLVCQTLYFCKAIGSFRMFSAVKTFPSR